jgi:transcriptional regulator with XRE-family HTH domain
MGLDVEKIKSLREKLGLSMQDAAEKAGIGSRQNWNKIESGANTNVKLETLEAIAKALGVSAKSLLKDEK